MYLNTSATGLDRKLLVPSSGSPSEITSLMKEIGLENFSSEGGKIGRKEMTASKLFGKDAVTAVDVKVSDDGIDIGGNKIEKVEIPSDERLLEIYGDKKEADLAKEFIGDEELRERLGVSRTTLYNWRKEGIIPYKRIGNKIFYPWKAIQEIMGQTL